MVSADSMMVAQNSPASGRMRAIRLNGFGGPGVFEAVEIEIPRPSPGEFLVRVKACGVCGHDVLSRSGKLSASKGDILGHEIAGTVEAVGSSDLDDWLGKRVALVQRRPCGKCPDCQAGHTSQCRLGPGFYGDDIQGGYAEFVLAGPLNAVRLPAAIDDVTAAVLSCGVGTGLHALRAAEITASDVVVITGAGGGVGLHAVQLASHYECRVIAITSNSDKVAAIEASGADEVLVRPSIREIRTVATRFGRPRGADAVLEITGAPQFATSLRVLAPRGRLVLIGNVRPETIPLDPGLTIVKELQIVGSSHATRDDLVEVINLVASGRIHPVIAQTFPLSEVAAAHAALEARNSAGRLVVVP